MAGPFLISCVAGTPPSLGGLVLFTKGEFKVVAPGSTTGFALHEDGERLVRALHSPAGGAVEILYADGQPHLISLPSCADIHDVMWDGDLIMVSDTGHNRVVWFDQLGNEVKEWQASGEGDAWHVGFFAPLLDGWAVTIFGRYKTHRGWLNNLPKGTGELVEVGTGEPIVTGLRAPHSPRPYKDGWIILNGMPTTLSIYSSQGVMTNSYELDRWARGLDVQGDQAWVAISPTRRTKDEMNPELRSSVRLVNLNTGRNVKEVDTPYHAEIYEVLSEVPVWLA